MFQPFALSNLKAMSLQCHALVKVFLAHACLSKQDRQKAFIFKANS